MCQFKGTSQIEIERHILESHVKENRNGKFSCDECGIEVESKEALWEHFQNQHRVEEASAIVVNDERAELLRLKGELKAVKSNLKSSMP